MKDIHEASVSYVNNKITSHEGVIKRGDIAEWLVDFAQQYHQEQLSKIPSEHGVRGKLSPIVLVLDLVELADNKSFHKEELNKQVVNAVSQARKSISALCNMFNEDYPKPELSKLPSDEDTLATQEAYQRGFDEGAQAAANDILG